MGGGWLGGPIMVAGTSQNWPINGGLASGDIADAEVEAL